MRDEDRVVAGSIELAIGLVADLDVLQRRTPDGRVVGIVKTFFSTSPS
jgi:hypothetical protein